MTNAHSIPLIGQSPPWLAVLDRALKWAPSKEPVLIVGETGTGKECLARWIHQESAVRHGPFVPVNCAAIPRELAESELFGHVRGAFTGAVLQRLGKCRRADKGTLFLDEIGEMDPVLQSKLLRFLQEGVVEAVGSDTPVSVQVRVIAATNQNLYQLFERRRFREDLFHRLNVLPLPVPPLRDRLDDIPLLAHYFLSPPDREERIPPVEIAPTVIHLLQQYAWPGNVRELKNLMMQLCLLQEEGYIALDHLPDHIRTRMNPFFTSTCRLVQLPDAGVDLRHFLGDVRTDLAHQALDRTGGNRSAAADLLGITRASLYVILKKQGVRHAVSRVAADMGEEPACANF